jgi:hypothetical protein
VRPARTADNSAVIVVPRVRVRMEAQHTILPLSLHDLLTGKLYLLPRYNVDKNYDRFRKLNNSMKNATLTRTLRSFTDFSLHIRSSFFAFSVQTVITNLHIRSFSVIYCYFLSVAGLDGCPTPVLVFCCLGKPEC